MPIHRRARSAVMVLLALVAGVAQLAVPAFSADGTRTYTKKQAVYLDVLQDLRMAIEAKGLVVGAVGDLAMMLERTSPTLGIEGKIYSGADYLNFCSAPLAHKFAAADAANVGYCPFLMFIYETVKRPGEVVVGYRIFTRMGNAGTIAILDEAEALLDGIAREAVK